MFLLLVKQNMGRREIGGSWQGRVDGWQPDPEHGYGHKQGQWNKSHTPEEVEEQVRMHLCYPVVVWVCEYEDSWRVWCLSRKIGKDRKARCLAGKAMKKGEAR